ncbi:MAG: TIGR03545 family protein [Treponema sp.]
MADDTLTTTNGGDAAKTEKKAKTVPAKKLPRMFKKQYTEKEFNRRILKKIYIPADADFIKAHFAPAKDKKGRDVLAVDLNADVIKSDAAKFKMLAKQIKAQKTSVKFIPLFAVVIFVAAVGVCVTMFKNIVVKKAMTSAMQGIFNAKTDIAKVDLQIFKSSLEIRGLQQANKDAPMKNLFEIDKIDFDFNLTELLRGKFDAENMEVTGVALGTDRKTSGALPEKKRRQKKQDGKIAGFDKKELADAAVNKLKAMFADYNPEKLLSDIQNELKSPDTAKKIADDVITRAEKWQSAPKEFETSIKDLSASVEKLVKTDWTSVSDPVQLKDSLETIKKAIDSGNDLSGKIKTASNGIAEDANAVKNYAADLQSAVKADISLVDGKIDMLKKTFSPAGLRQIMNDAVRSMMYELLGKYAPYAEKAIDAAQTARANAQGNAKKKAKKSTKKAPRRQKGRTVYYKADRVPKFLIERAAASGYEHNSDSLLFKAVAEEISSNQDVRGKPAKLSADFKIGSHANAAHATLDLRTTSSMPLISADYAGDGYPLGLNAGVFAFKSAAGIRADFAADSDGSFSAGGELAMSVSEMSGIDFEPAKVCEIYKKAIAGITHLNVGFKVRRTSDGAFEVEILNPERLAEQLSSPIIAAVTSELTEIAKDAQKQVAALLSEKTGGATDALTQFTSIEDAIKAQRKQAAALEAQLEAKKAEIEKQLKNAASNAASDALEKAGVSIPSEATDALKKFKLF